MAKVEGESRAAAPGYFATTFGLITGVVGGAYLGGWFGSLDADNDIFGVGVFLWGVLGGWAGGGAGIWLALTAFRRSSASATALLFMVLSIPTALVFVPLAVWFAPLALWIATTGLIVSGCLARWIVTAQDSKDPFTDRPKATALGSGK